MRKTNTLGSRLFMVLSFFFLYAPIFVLMAFSFNTTKSRTVWSGFTLKWYGELLKDRQIMEAVTTTLSVAIISTVLATVIGTFAAVGFYNLKRKWRAPLMTVNNLPLVNADIVTGVSLCLFFVAGFSMLGTTTQWMNDVMGTNLPTKFYMGFPTLLIAHMTFNIPYVILNVMPKLQQMDSHLIEAAQDLGCTWMQAFWKVAIPEIKPGIISGMMMAFTMSVDDFVISYFTAGSSVSTLSMVIYGMTKKSISPKINAISTLIFVLVLLILIAYNIREIRLEKKKAKHRH